MVGGGGIEFGAHTLKKQIGDEGVDAVLDAKTKPEGVWTLSALVACWPHATFSSKDPRLETMMQPFFQTSTEAMI